MGILRTSTSATLIILLSIVIGGVIVAAKAQPPPVTEATLHQIAASLQMYVDELPQIPKLLGFTPSYGIPKPGRLTVGMYKTTWVCAFFFDNTQRIHISSECFAAIYFVYDIKARNERITCTFF